MASIWWAVGFLGQENLGKENNKLMNISHTSASRMTVNRSWGSLAVIIFIAGAIRVYFLTGFQGTDDLVFAKVAYNIANGSFKPGTYIGTLRYGLNLPLAISTMFFGFNEYALTLYPLITSLVTILMVYLIGKDLFGRQVGLGAAVLMAFCPLDIIWAGRIQADAPLLMFMVASCLLFFKAMENHANVHVANGLFFASGVLLGLGYATKNVAIFLGPFLGFLAWYRTVWLFRMAWVVGGFLVVFAAEAAFFFWQTGDPLYPFTVQSLHNKKVASIVSMGDSAELVSWPLAYPYWAFVGLQHVGLTFYLAAVAWAVYFFRKTSGALEVRRKVVMLFAWFLSILLILTFYVMSWKPFVLIWKQPNYMLMFIPPLLLLTAFYLMVLNRTWRTVVMVIYAVTSLVFTSVEREVLAAESSNARATARWYLEEGRGVPLYCGVRDCGMVSLLAGYKDESRLIPYNDPFQNIAGPADLTSIRWGVVAINNHWLKRSGESVTSQNRQIIESPPAEWKLIRVLKHESHGVLYWGRRVVAEIGRHGMVPQQLVSVVERKIREAVEPDPVWIYQVGEYAGTRKTP